MKGKKSHGLVSDALKILVHLDHRGAVGCEPNTGDGAGILIQVPHEFFAAGAAKLGFKLPAAGQYGVGQLFLPKNLAEREAVEGRASPRLLPTKARPCWAGAMCPRMFFAWQTAVASEPSHGPGDY